jgi:hypothetical protein
VGQNSRLPVISSARYLPSRQEEGIVPWRDQTHHAYWFIVKPDLSALT